MRKTAVGLIFIASLAAGCNTAVSGTVVGNGKTPTACQAEADKPVAVSVETNEVRTQADGNPGKVVKVVCLSEDAATAYPIGSTYP